MVIVLVGSSKATDIQEDGIMGKDLGPMSAPEAMKVPLPRHLAQALQEGELHEGHFLAVKLEILIKRRFGDRHDELSTPRSESFGVQIAACQHAYIYIIYMHDEHVYMKDKLNTSMLYVHPVSNDSSNSWTRALRIGSHILKLLQEKYVEDNQPSHCTHTDNIYIYMSE